MESIKKNTWAMTILATPFPTSQAPLSFILELSTWSFQKQ